MSVPHLANVYPTLYEVQKSFVDAGVVGKLGVESGGKQMALTHEDRETIALGENGDTLADLLNRTGAELTRHTSATYAADTQLRSDLGLPAMTLGQFL